MRPTVVLINDRETLKATQATAAICRELSARRQPTWVAGIAGLWVAEDGRCLVQACRVTDGRLGAELVPHDLADMDVWVRLNPGRDSRSWAPAYALQVLCAAQRRGTRVRNDPHALLKHGTKLSLTALTSQDIPSTRFAVDVAVLAEAVRARSEPSVLKPALGTHGQGVIAVEPTDPELDSKLAALAAAGPVVVQAMHPAALQGDVRVHLVDGAPLVVGGRRAAVARVPAAGDFRSNIAAGGSARRAAWTEELEGVVARVGPQLRDEGLFHVGLDVMGATVLEVNAFSPGGLGDAGAFEERDFVGGLVDAFLAA